MHLRIFPSIPRATQRRTDRWNPGCLGTDGQWRSTLDGPARWSDLLDGEAYDCRRDRSGWYQPGFDDRALNHLKTPHLTIRNGSAALEQEFAENAAVLRTGKAGKPLEIISAAYGFDAADLGDAQGSYAIALQFGLLDEPLRSQAAKRSVQLVVKNGHHPTTGFWSSIELLLSLSNAGYHADAAEMLNRREQPSWGYMVDHSTTLWEAFNANSQNPSLNHWTHSAASEWLWRNIAGINPDEQHPGYQSFIIRPLPTKEVTWCNASYDSIRGRITSRWKSEGDKFTLAITVPGNTPPLSSSRRPMPIR